MEMVLELAVNFSVITHGKNFNLLMFLLQMTAIKLYSFEYKYCLKPRKKTLKNGHVKYVRLDHLIFTEVSYK